MFPTGCPCDQPTTIPQAPCRPVAAPHCPAAAPHRPTTDTPLPHHGRESTQGSRARPAAHQDPIHTHPVQPFGGPFGMSCCPSHSLLEGTGLEGTGQHAHQAGRGPHVIHQGSLRAAAAGNSQLAEQFGFQSLEGRDLLHQQAPKREGSHMPLARRVFRRGLSQRA